MDLAWYGLDLPIDKFLARSSFGGWLLSASPRMPIFESRERRTPRWVAIAASPECQFLSRVGEERLGGWLLGRAPECQFLSRVSEERLGGGYCGEPPSANFWVA